MATLTQITGAAAPQPRRKNMETSIEYKGQTVTFRTRENNEIGWCSHWELIHEIPEVIIGKPDKACFGHQEAYLKLDARPA